MKRTKKRVPASAILVADLHLSETIPVSRTDDYLAAQERKLNFLRRLKEQNGDCPILCAGDIFHTWRASPWFCAWAYQHLPPMIVIPGNHDLPQHSLDNYHKSVLALLETVAPERYYVLRGGRVNCGDFDVTGVPFGQWETYQSSEDQLSTRKHVLMIHELVFPSLESFFVPGSVASSDMIRHFKDDFDLILTGDNHTTFVDKEDGCLLVNPGSMLRSTADQIDHRPVSFLYYADSNDVIPVEFPIEERVINREHIDTKKERDERIVAYIDRMNQDWEISLSYRKNLESFFSENDTPKKVREIIWNQLEG